MVLRGPPWCSIVGATVTVHQFFCFLNCMLNKNGNETNKNPKGRSTLKSTSLSGFGEKKSYTKNIPGGGGGGGGGEFLFQGESFLFIK